MRRAWLLVFASVGACNTADGGAPAADDASGAPDAATTPLADATSPADAPGADVPGADAPGADASAPGDAARDATPPLTDAGLPTALFAQAGVFVVSPASTFPASSFGDTARANHFAWVALQILDGTTPLDEGSWSAWMTAWRPFVKHVGAWGVNRTNPAAEADAAAQKLLQYGFDFYIADAEQEYKYTQSPCNATCPCSGACTNSQCFSAACFQRSTTFTAAFRTKMGDAFPAAMSTFGRVDLADIDYGAWRAKAFHFMPQTYWNMDPIYQPSLSVAAAVTAKLCAGAPCWTPDLVHPTIGLWQSLPTPGASTYMTDLAAAKAAHGNVGFSIFRADGVANGDWAVMGKAIDQQALASP